MFYNPGHPEFSYDRAVREAEKSPSRWRLCTGCRDEDDKCENCGAKLRTEGISGLPLEMRPCSFGCYPPDEHTAERCRNRRARVREFVDPELKVEDAPPQRFSPDTFEY
jgi:hypothetical protein